MNEKYIIDKVTGVIREINEYTILYHNIKLLRYKLDKIFNELHECVENKKKLDDTLVYGNYEFLIGKYFGIMDIFEYVNMEEWAKRYEQDKPQLDKWTEWANKLYRKFTENDGNIPKEENL